MAKCHASRRLTWLILLAPEPQTGGAAEHEDKLLYLGLKVGEEKKPVFTRSESKKVELKLYSVVPWDPPGRQGVTPVSVIHSCHLVLAGSRRNLKATSLSCSAVLGKEG